MKLSVIIPTYWQSDLCCVHVREAMEGTVIPDEIVVINDGGDPGLEDKLCQISKKTNVIYARILEDVGFNYNGACNLGVWLSRGDYVTVEDVDHIPLRQAYENGISILDTRPEISRVAYRRQWVPLAHVLERSFSEWEPYGGLGCNAMVAMYRRELMLDMKGQDERMREYGWLAYDFKNRLVKLKVQHAVTFGFLIVKDGSEPNIDRHMSVTNRRIYRQNVARLHPHEEGGILRFTFEVTRFPKGLQSK